MCISFTDPGWPDAKWIYGGDDPNFDIYGNQWYFANINGTWYGGPGEWLYRGAATLQGRTGHQHHRSRQRLRQPVRQLGPEAGRARRLRRSRVGARAAADGDGAGTDRRRARAVARLLASGVHGPGVQFKKRCDAISRREDDDDAIRSASGDGNPDVRCEPRRAQTRAGGGAGRPRLRRVQLQSAFGNVTSQSYGGEVGVTVRPKLQVFVEGGMVRDVATAEIGTAAQLDRRLPRRRRSRTSRSASRSR